MLSDIEKKYCQAIKVYLDWLSEARRCLEEADQKNAEAVHIVRAQAELDNMLSLLGQLPMPENAAAVELKSLVEQTISAFLEKDKAQLALEQEPASSELIERAFYWNVVAAKTEASARQKYADFCHD